MEVNINNAFSIVVRISWRYCNVSLENFALSLFKAFEMMIYLLLENPVVTTLILSVLILILMILLSISFIILACVSCLIAFIIVCEGIICLIFLLVAGIVVCCLLITMGNIHGIHIWLNRLFKHDTRKTDIE
ncbi:hypothetical protein ABMA27_013919 [Loxostege sticticalis]|uniref:NADH dehydrogenase subunit 4L n=1 Tax=Loxostege sticticalis TaxID=481309 RepID=A0ABR3IBZ0_LOXSC